MEGREDSGFLICKQSFIKIFLRPLFSITAFDVASEMSRGLGGGGIQP